MTQSYLLELFAFAVVAINVFIVYATTHVSWSLKNKIATGVLVAAADVIVIPTTLNSVLDEYFGYKVDIRICRIIGSCVAMSSAPSDNQDRSPTNGGGIASADLVQVCRMGLNSEHDGWSTGFEFQSYVAEAQRRRKTVDDCRRVLGLRSLSEEIAEKARIEEARRLRSLDQARLCGEAIDDASGEWDLSAGARGAIDEARDRGLTKETCLVALGWSVPGLPAAPLAEPRGPAPAAPEFPTGYVRNPRYAFANLRESPGSTSRVVKQLANGTEVVLLGTKPSPASGHMYCRVLTRDGVAGYVDHELVDRTCVLTPAQTSYLMEAERQEKMQAFQIFRDIAVIGLGLALKR